MERPKGIKQMEATKTAHPLVRLWRFATAQRADMTLATVFSVLNKIFDLAPPALIGAAVDVVVQREDSIVASFGFPEVGTQLWILAGLTLIIFALESVFQYCYSVLWRNLAQSLEHELRIDAYAHVQDLDMTYFEDRSSGGLMAILNDDINQLERFLDGGANDVLQLITTILVIGGIFFYFAASVAWMAALPMPFIMWGSIKFQQRLAPRYMRVRERVGMLSSQLANNLGGIATIKSFTTEKYELERISY